MAAGFMGGTDAEVASGSAAAWGIFASYYFFTRLALGASVRFAAARIVRSQKSR
jgi:hypothetical protein